MTSFALARLTSRKLLKISGPDCYAYLQGLICNDLRYLYEPDRMPKRKHAALTSSVMNTFMLNAQGRVICDIILYRTPLTRFSCEFTPPGIATEPDELYLECESSLASGLANTLYAYRVRRKISLQILDNTHVWCLFPKLNFTQIKPPNHEDQPIDEQVIMHETVEKQFESVSQTDVISNDITVVADPRIRLMGLRVLSDRNNFIDVKNSIESIIQCDSIQEATLKDYIVHRYRLGIGEGEKDHPESSCFPLECNADKLGAVSFNKGCYLGQELTARIHFTGVIRKRLMPVILDRGSDRTSEVKPLIYNTNIHDEITNKKLGLVRQVVKGHALALLRHDLINENTKLIHADTSTRLLAHKPYWWSQSYNA